MDWFEVDREGLARLLERKGKEFVLFELLQNAWDQKVGFVRASLTKQPGSRSAVLRVEDDDPDGFSNLSHAFTLFAESAKKGDASQRGRFNLGEKLVLALCEEAEILSTTGGFRFDKGGRHRLRARRQAGTVFEGRLKLTNEEFAGCCAAVRRLIPPSGVVTTFNGEQLARREPVASFEAVLRTEVADAEGYLRPTSRKAAVRLYEPLPGEAAALYELGIPVVETQDRYHVDVQQKVPVNFDRDNVPPAYLRTLRTMVLNATYDRLGAEDAASPWVRDALADERASPEAVRAAVGARFGSAVAADPSDPEANKRAVAAGYTVVSGGSLSKAEWESVRRAGALPPAGRVTPSPKPFSDDPEARPLKMLAPEKWSAAEAAFAERARRVARALIGRDISVEIAADPTWPFAGCFGGLRLIVNKGRLGAAFFGPADRRQLGFLIHELAHHHCTDHLSDRYHEALTDLGGALAVAAAADPGLLA